ncbi:MAG: TIGR03118 family protein [Edaphobacter sp.]
MQTRSILETGAYTVLALMLAAASLTPASAQNVQHYKQTNLTSDQASLAPTRDANLVNPWGLARSSGSPWWIGNNGSGFSTLYDGTGKIIPLVVTIPSNDPSTGAGSPSGVIFNGDPSAFQVAPGKSAIFLFVTEDGTISGWNPGVKPTTAVVVVNNKEKSVFKGATIATATVGGMAQSFLYVADFRRGQIAVFDSSFKPAQLRPDRDGDNDGDRDSNAFSDEELPDGYVPFNVQNIGGNLYVSFARQDSAKHDQVDGAGHGYVDVFSPTGKLLHRLQHGAWFNSPWGMVLASTDFGANSHDVLVGQFGSGEILVFDPVTGKFKGTLNNASNNPIVIDRIWSLQFGNGGAAGPANSLFFTAGINNEQDGLFGTITAVENLQGNDQ